MKTKSIPTRALPALLALALALAGRPAQAQENSPFPAPSTNQLDPATRLMLQQKLREAIARRSGTNAPVFPAFPDPSTNVTPAAATNAMTGMTNNADAGLTNAPGGRTHRTPRSVSNLPGSSTNISSLANGTNRIPVINAAVTGPLGTPAAPTLPANVLSGQAVPVPTPISPVQAAPVGAPANLPPVARQIPAPAAPAAMPMPAAPPEQVLKPGEIDFQDVKIDQVLEVYAKLMGRTILHAQLPQATIQLHTETDLTTTEALQALDSVLAMNGITMIPVGDKFVKAVANNLAQAQGTKFNTNDEASLPEADQYVSQVIQLKAAKPSEIMPTLTPFAGVPNGILPIDSSMVLVIRDYAANIKRMLELIKQIDIVPPSDFDEEVIPIRYAKASEIAAALSSLGAGTGTSIGSTGSGGGTRSGGLGGGAGGAYGSGTTGGLNRGLGGSGGIGTQGTTGTARTSTFSDRLGSIINNAAKGGGAGEFKLFGQTKIIADERTNSLLIFASKPDLKLIRDLIDKLDTVLPQVLIEAIVMEVTLDHGFNLGVSVAQNQPSTPGSYFSGIGAVNNGNFLNSSAFGNAATNLNALPSGLSYFGNFGSDFQATVTAAMTDSRIHVLSRPHIQTSHGVTAQLQVGQTVPEVSGTYFGGINGQASSQYQQQFVGIDLQVTPLINPDGLVVMEINTDVQQLGPNYTIDNNQVPSTTTRSANSTVSVRDKDTIMLGGMISGNRKRSDSGVPVLMNIPVLGALFRSRSDSSERVELIILIHPTVLKTPEVAALQAQKVKDHMPGVKAAEREDIIEENVNQRAADKIKVPDRE